MGKSTILAEQHRIPTIILQEHTRTRKIKINGWQHFLACEYQSQKGALVATILWGKIINRSDGVRISH